jgi:hypothetical protein
MRSLPGKAFGMSGFLGDTADRHELVPLLRTRGGAGGYVTRDAYERRIRAHCEPAAHMRLLRRFAAMPTSPKPIIISA